MWCTICYLALKFVAWTYECFSYWQEDFFGELHKILSEIPEVTEIHPVPDAHVPVMKFKCSGISIDLLYAKLSLWVIPEVSAGFMSAASWFAFLAFSTMLYFLGPLSLFLSHFHSILCT